MTCENEVSIDKHEERCVSSLHAAPTPTWQLFEYRLFHCCAQGQFTWGAERGGNMILEEAQALCTTDLRNVRLN